MGQTSGGNAGNLELLKKIEEQQAEIEELKSPKRVLLWENPNPTVPFEEQQVQVNLEGYSLLEITYRIRINSSWKFPPFFSSTEPHFQQSGTYLSEGKTYYRGIEVELNKINFQSCGFYSQYAGSISVDNQYCIPYKIYGIKLQED